MGRDIYGDRSALSESEGIFDFEGDIFMPNPDSFGATPGGFDGSGTTSGTTGRILPPGAGGPLDDMEF